MRLITKLSVYFFLMTLLFVGTIELDARTMANSKGNDKSKNDEILIARKRGVFDLQKNTVSNIDFYTTNYGIFGLNILQNRGGGFWPRGSQNQYIFGGGLWFAARKFLRAGDTIPRKLVEVTYNPNSGVSWMVPGRISAGDLLNSSDPKTYRTYFSTDFNKSDGKSFDANDGPNWPIWDSSPYANDTLKNNRYFGYYIDDVDQRNNKPGSGYPKGPAFITQEDIFATYKDTDLNYFEGGFGLRSDQGYPMRLQFEQTIYSWGFGDYKDFIFLKFDIFNTSSDTLWNCWMAPVMDLDIGQYPNVRADNDRVRYYDEEDTLNLAFQWTQSSSEPTEKGKGFGYIGMDFLESPAVMKCEQTIDTIIEGTPKTFCQMCIEKHDSTYFEKDPVDTNKLIKHVVTVCDKKLAFDPKSEYFPRKDKRAYNVKYQLGLRTFKNWSINDDIIEDEARYNALASQVREGDNGQGDKRFMMATGPFNFAPGDTVRVVVGMILANTSIQTDADGSVADVQELVRKDKFAQKVYDENFKAPIPPEQAHVSYYPLNNAIKVIWDNTSEMSNDVYERGLDFMGYRLYRARKPMLDSFDLSEIKPNNSSPSGKGIFGWKQIAQWQIPTPFNKSYNRAGNDNNDLQQPQIDSMLIAGPNIIANTIDTFSIKILKIAKGVILANPQSWVRSYLSPITGGYYLPCIMGFDTALFAKPWGGYFAKKMNFNNLNQYPILYDPFNPNKYHSYIIDSVMLGAVKLNSSLLAYNPLMWKKETFAINPADTATLKDKVVDTVYFKNTYKNGNINGQQVLLIDRMVPYSIDKAMKDTLHLRAVLDSVYSYIKRGLIVSYDFPDFEGDTNVIKAVVLPYIDSITNHRTFVDIGDDNKNYTIAFDDDPTKTEKIINNVDYYYKVLAWDEGDYTKPTPIKLNQGFLGSPNVTAAYPKENPPRNGIKFTITSVDSQKIGGLYNFNFFALNDDRVQQLYTNHTLELEFNPIWGLSTTGFTQGPGLPLRTVDFGLYRRNVILRDLGTPEKPDNKLLFNGFPLLEVSLCDPSYRELFTENALSYVLSDTVVVDSVPYKVFRDSVKYIKFGLADNKDIVYRSGHFTSGDFTQDNYCYAPNFSNEAVGTLGFGFDFTVQQRGGVYRPDTAYVINSNAVTPITYLSTTKSADNVLTTNQVDFDVYFQQFQGAPNGAWGISGFGAPLYGSFNNGPGDYQVEFVQGGEDVMKLSWGNNAANENTFKVPFLQVKVTNLASYSRPGLNNKTVSVNFPDSVEFKFINIDTLYPTRKNYFPDVRSLRRNCNDFIGKYNLCSWGYVNVRPINSPLKYKAQHASPTDSVFKGQSNAYVGQQGKYYLTGISLDGKDTVDFVNQIQIAGTSFIFDYARKNRRYGQTTVDFDYLEQNVNKTYGPDFAVGDKVMLKTTGGAMGLPLPGAKVRVKVENADPDIKNMTDDLLNEINVVPNPYYITHEGQKSPYDAKIYFTRLPKECTIDIYTVTGDHLKTLRHDEVTSPEKDQIAIQVWDLLTNNSQRVASQALIAIITTPNGAKTVKHFSVVVGGFRLVTE